MLCCFSLSNKAALKIKTIIYRIHKNTRSPLPDRVWQRKTHKHPVESGEKKITFASFFFIHSTVCVSLTVFLPFTLSFLRWMPFKYLGRIPLKANKRSIKCYSILKACLKSIMCCFCEAFRGNNVETCVLCQVLGIMWNSSVERSAWLWSARPQVLKTSQVNNRDEHHS